MSDTILSVERLSKNFSGLQAVSDASFSVRRNTIAALIGPNGAGKSTAFNLICGIDRPSGGRIVFEGTDVTPLAAHQRARLGLGRMFQTPRIFEHLTVIENVMVGFDRTLRSGLLWSGLRLPSVAAEERRIRGEAHDLLAGVGLAGAAERMAGELAFGSQRLLEFARAMAAAPKLLLLDEPTAGLTPAETDAFSEMLRSIVTQGVTVFVVEHDLHFITSIAASVVVLAHGKVIYDGAPGGLRDDPAVVESYVGTPRRAADA